jgi:ribose transport system ATP-binding protein
MSVDGTPYAPRSPLDARAAGVALIHQELALCEHLSVAENIWLGGEMRSGPVLASAQMASQSRAILARLGHGELDPHTEVRRLSPATKQVVEIAKSLARKAHTFIFDEPTSSLGKQDVGHLFEQVRALCKSGCTVIYISHFLDEVMEIADRVVVLRDGKNAGSVDVAQTSTAELVRLMVGREVSELYPRSAREHGDVLLSAEMLAGRTKPTSASLQTRRGEVFGVAGLNGSGRSELLRVIFGLDAIRSGSIKFGAYSGFDKPHDRWWQGMGFLSEDRKAEGLALRLSIADNILMPRPGKSGVVLPRYQISRAELWIQKLRIRCKGAEQPVGELSGGNQQKVALARILEQDSALLLLDEPTRGIDIGSKAEIYSVIDELASKGKSVILVSSYLPELLGVCDRIAVMNRGTLAEPVAASGTDQERLMEMCVSA